MSQSYGLGAMAYFRRVVENAVNSLLDLVDEAAKADGDDDALSAVREARESHIAEDKLRIVADHLPRTLRPYGVNPLALLHDQFSHGIHARQDLEDILNLGGSAWMVAPNGRGLSRRVDRSAVDAAKLVMSNGSRAAKILGEAWQHVYGRNPNPSEGYHQAVRAAETAACRVIIPADPAGSLGKAIAALKHAPAGSSRPCSRSWTRATRSSPSVASWSFCGSSTLTVTERRTRKSRCRFRKQKLRPRCLLRWHSSNGSSVA